MPVLPVTRGRDAGESDHHRNLLAVPGVRRGVESCQSRTDTSTSKALVMVRSATPLLKQEMLADLRELIAAIDRRVPYLERDGAGRIAQEAAILRQQANTLITEIEATARTTRRHRVTRLLMRPAIVGIHDRSMLAAARGSGLVQPIDPQQNRRLGDDAHSASRSGPIHAHHRPTRRYGQRRGQRYTEKRLPQQIERR